MKMLIHHCLDQKKMLHSSLLSISPSSCIQKRVKKPRKSFKGEPYFLLQRNASLKKKIVPRTMKFFESTNYSPSSLEWRERQYWPMCIKYLLLIELDVLFHGALCPAHCEHLFIFKNKL